VRTNEVYPLIAIAFHINNIFKKYINLQSLQRLLHLLLSNLLEIRQLIDLLIQKLNFFSKTADLMFGTFKFHLENFNDK